MSNWISGSDLIEKWDIRASELLDYVCKGLQPYHPETGQPIPSPDIEEKKHQLSWRHEYIEELKTGCKFRFACPNIPEDFSIDKYPKLAAQSFYAPFEKDQKEALKKEIELFQCEADSLEREISKTGTSWKGYNPDSEGQSLYVIAQLKECLFKQEDIEQFESTKQIGANKNRL
jgi:hypothetical protein